MLYQIRHMIVRFASLEGLARQRTAGTSGGFLRPIRRRAETPIVSGCNSHLTTD